MRIGIIGTGQLGQMLALAGIPLGHDFFLYDWEQQLVYDSLNITRAGKTCSPQAFFQNCDLITYESENTLIAPLESIPVPLYPPLTALSAAQHRFREKSLFRTLNIPSTDFCLIQDHPSLQAAAQHLGLPLFLKTTTLGYDGKGQALVKTAQELIPAWKSVGQKECIAEAFVSFKRELSIIGCRDHTGNIVYYPLTENHHRAGILRLSTAPASNSQALGSTARTYLEKLLEHTQYCGILALELFETEQGLVANEMAPRVHNSGHWTLHGSNCSQFENHIRAITHMPLVTPFPLSERVAMINFIGELPILDPLLAKPQYHVHLYGKAPRPNRKLGHLTLLASDDQQLSLELDQLQGLL